MPLRSEYTIEQFEEVFQKLAHDIPRFRRVKGEDFSITFHYTDDGEPRKISVQIHKKTGRKTRWGDDEVEWWGFTIERKLYNTSPHSTKIDFGPYKEVEEKVKKFLQDVMDGIKPKPRFSLASHARKSNRKLTDYKAFSKRKRRKS